MVNNNDTEDDTEDSNIDEDKRKTLKQAGAAAGVGGLLGTAGCTSDANEQEDDANEQQKFRSHVFEVDVGVKAHPDNPDLNELSVTLKAKVKDTRTEDSVTDHKGNVRNALEHALKKWRDMRKDTLEGIVNDDKKEDLFLSNVRVEIEENYSETNVIWTKIHGHGTSKPVDT